MAKTLPEPSEPKSDRPAKDAPLAQTAAEVQRGVRQQRRHIKDLTGEDPLRGGIAD